MGELPIPPHFDLESVGRVWRVPYEERAREAAAWARAHGVAPAARDDFRLCLLLVDVQNTFCIPGFELFVAGRSGSAAVDDNRRLCAFVYRNLRSITQIISTMDTHRAMQIFHPVALVDERGTHPAPYTLVSAEEVERGAWRVSPELCLALGRDPDLAQRHLLHYARALEKSGRHRLTIWPYHSLLGGIGHALVSALEEAVFFHSLARSAQAEFEVKGSSPLSEHYSALGPEVVAGPDGEPIAGRNTALVERLLGFDAVLIAGQAKSHCVVWTVEDLLKDAAARGLAGKVYLLDDCTSPVVVPGVVDYTDEAEAAFVRFAAAGVHRVRSDDPIAAWPGGASRR